MRLARSVFFFPPLVAHGILEFTNRSDGLCWGSGVPASERKWKGPAGRNLTIGMAVAHRTSHEIASRILIILIRERLGIHVDVYGEYAYDAFTQYLSVAGCKDFADWTCDDYDGTDPPVHFTTEFWTKRQDPTWLSDVSSWDPLVHSRVVHMGAMGYVIQAKSYVWAWAKERAKALSGVSLDWYEDLMEESALSYFTLLQDMDLTYGIYQSCEHTDSEHLLSWGYVCNPEFMMDNPWREPGADGLWNESGLFPTKMRPLFNCTEVEELYPHVAEAYAALDYVCRGEGWWLSQSCHEKSPGEEYLGLCIPAVSADCSRLPAASAGLSLFPTAVACVTWSDVLTEYFHDWDMGHMRRGQNPCVVIFEWFEPDASVPLRHGTPDMPAEYTAIKSADWTRSDMSTITTITHENVYSLAPDVASLLESFTISQDEIYQLIGLTQTLAANLGDVDLGKDEAACWWVVEHEAVWMSWTGAESCWADTYYDEELGRCQLCPSGTTSPRASTGVESCESCQDGLVYQDGACVSCAPGSYASASLQLCVLCEWGRFNAAEQASACVDCRDGFTTVDVGSHTEDRCVCAEGAYLPLNSSTCVGCPEGMVCPTGSDDQSNLPGIEWGYWSTAEDPFTIYLCTEAAHCTGGAPHSCAPNRDTHSMACGLCQDGAYEDGQGDCQPCAGGSALLVILLCVLGSLCLTAVVHFAVNRNVLQQRLSMITCVSVLGLTVTAMQTLGVCSSLSVSMVSPLKELINSISLLSFNVNVMQMDCFFGSGAVSKFFWRQCVVPGILLLVSLVVSVNWLLGRKAGVVRELSNTCGTIVNVFFISLLLTAITPFVVYSHPGDTGLSVRAFPSVLTHKPEFHMMSVISVGALLGIVCPFVAVICYATLMYPRFVGNPHKQQSLQLFRFLFYRFRPQTYYYGLIVMLRSTLLCFVPVVVRDDAAAQVLLMSLILQLAVVIQALTRPWKHMLTNILDGVLTAGVQLIVVCAAINLETKSDRMLFWLGLLCALFVLCNVVAGLSYAVYLRLHPTPYYHYFICHHKAGGAAQARLLKNMLARRTRCSVFIDSDDLRELTNLFDIVQCKVHNLIVYLTSDTLSRPWCCGEIVTAFRNQVRTSVIHACKDPSVAQQIRKLDVCGEAVLSKHYINEQDICAAYAWLLDSDEVRRVEVPEMSSTRELFETVVADVLGLKRSTAGPRQDPAYKDALLISVDTMDMEAAASAVILAMNIEEDFLAMSSSCSGVRLMSDMNDVDINVTVSQVLGCVVLLSLRSLESTMQIRTIMAAMELEQERGSFLVVVATPSFTFPSASWYDHVLPRLLGGDHLRGRKLLGKFFSKIAIQFSPHSSDSILKTQSHQVLSWVEQSQTLVTTTRVRVSHEQAPNLDV